MEFNEVIHSEPGLSGVSIDKESKVEVASEIE